MASKHVLRLSGILCGNEAGKLARRDIVRIVAGAQRVLTRHGTGDSWGKRLAIVVRDGRSKLQAVAPRPRKAFHVRAGAHDRQLRALHKVMAEMYELARTQTAAPLGEPVTGVPASEDVQAGDAVDLKDLEDPQLDGGDQDNADGKYAHAGAAVDLEDPRRDGGDQGRDGGSDPGGDQGRDGGSDPGGGQGRDGGSAPGSRDEGSAPVARTRSAGTRAAARTAPPVPAARALLKVLRRRTRVFAAQLRCTTRSGASYAPKPARLRWRTQKRVTSGVYALPTSRRLCWKCGRFEFGTTLPASCC